VKTHDADGNTIINLGRKDGVRYRLFRHDDGSVWFVEHYVGGGWFDAQDPTCTIARRAFWAGVMAGREHRSSIPNLIAACRAAFDYIVEDFDAMDPADIAEQDPDTGSILHQLDLAIRDAEGREL
jgi:hypothetical protein